MHIRVTRRDLKFSRVRRQFFEKHKSLVSIVYVCCDDSDPVVECCVVCTKSVPSLKFESVLEV